MKRIKEYIEREKAKQILVDDYAYAAANLLDTVPTADVQTVVRCKNCRCYNKRYGECTLFGCPFIMMNRLGQKTFIIRL